MKGPNVRDITGYIEADGKKIEPVVTTRHREAKINDFEALHRVLRIYSRDDIRRLDRAWLARYGAHLDRYDEDGSVTISTGDSLVKMYRGSRLVHQTLEVPRKGVDVATREAIRLLTLHPLLLSSEPWAEDKKTEDKTEKPPRR